MIFFQLSVVVALIVDAVLGVLVYFVNPRRPANRHFLVLTIAVSAWLATLVGGSLARDAGWIKFWMHAAGVGGVLVPPAVDTLRLAITGHDGYRHQIRRRLLLWLILLIPVVLLCQSDVFIRGLVTRPGRFPEPVYGPGNVVYMAFLLLAVGLLLIELRKDLRTLSGVRRAELNFALLGCASGLFSAVFLAQVLPALIGNWAVAQFAPLSVIFLDGFVAYGIATRRIMNVTDLLRRGVAYGVLAAVLIALYLAVWGIATWGLAVLFGPPALLPHLLAALVVAFSMAPAIGGAQALAARLFLSASVLNVQDAIRDITRLLQSITTLDQLLERFCKTTAAAVGAERALILLPEGNAFCQRYPPPTDGDAMRLAADDPLVLHLRTHPDPLERDVARRIYHDAPLWRACGSLAGLGLDLAVGIRSKGALAGLLLLGRRLSGRIYGAREQDGLQLVGDQLAIAIDNARLYTEVQHGKLYNEFLVDHLVSGVIAVDAAQRVTVFNREAQRITGRPAHGTLGASAEALPPPLAAIIRNTLASGAGVRDIDLALRTASEVPIRLGSAIFQGQDHRVLGALLVFNDLTDLRKLELQVRRSDRLASLGTLAAGMAHEIKNPLVTIKTFTQLLPERYADADFRTSFATLVEQEIERIDGIVNELLTLARPAKPVLSCMHLHAVLDRALALIQQQLWQKHIDLVRGLDAPRDAIQGDANLLSQMFINLFLNAIEAMDTVTTRRILSVRTRVAARPVQAGDAPLAGPTVPHLTVMIRDTGEGILPEDLGHIFDPFFTTKSSGTGLGLSVAHRIVKEHQGQMDVESDRGNGTVFHISIPLDERADGAAGATPAAGNL